MFQVQILAAVAAIAEHIPVESAGHMALSSDKSWYLPVGTGIEILAGQPST
jgi:undecaprenyl pyrophosphate phosphatase UppP